MDNRNNTFPKKKFFLVGDMVKVVNKRHKMSGKFGLVARLSSNNTHDHSALILVKIGKILYQFKSRDIKFCTRIKRHFDKKNKNSVDHGLLALDSEVYSDNYSRSYNSRVRELVDLVDDVDSSDSDDNFGNR